MDQATPSTLHSEPSYSGGHGAAPLRDLPTSAIGGKAEVGTLKRTSRLSAGQ